MLSRSPIGDTQRLIDSGYVSVRATSAGLGWSSAFVSDQAEVPYQARLSTGSDILVSLITHGRLTANFQCGNSGQIYSGGAGRIVIIPDHQSFDVELFSKVRTTHFYISRSMLDGVAQEDYGWNPRCTRILPRFAITDPLLAQICRGIRSELGVDSSISRPYVNKMLHAVATHLLRKYSNIVAEKNGAFPNSRLSEDHLAYIEKLIRTRLSEALTIDHLANGIDMSRDHFIRLFKQKIGITPYQYVIRARVEEAQRLLEQTDTPIAQIAQECGFADQVNLTRAFQRHSGETPGNYRKNTRSIDRS